MSDDSVNRPPRMRWLLWVEVVALLALASFFVLTGVRIAHEGSLQELHPADAIVVFGAAEYAGHPSPVLRARLDHAFPLFLNVFAPVVITTGRAPSCPSLSQGASR